MTNNKHYIETEFLNIIPSLTDGRVPYTYVIGWEKLDVWYYGVRYGKNCHPSDFWKIYKTSSKEVKKFIEENGDPDLIKITRVFKTIEEALNHERNIHIRMDVARNPKWLNKAITKNIYNITPETIKKVADFHKGRKRSIETCENISKALKGKRIGKNNPNYNKKMSEETKLKISLATTGRKAHNKGKLQKKFECVNCKQMYNELNLKRWHNDNCKTK